MSTSVDESSVRAAYEDVRSDTTDTEWCVCLADVIFENKDEDMDDIN